MLCVAAKHSAATTLLFIFAFFISLTVRQVCGMYARTYKYTKQSINSLAKLLIDGWSTKKFYNRWIDIAYKQACLLSRYSYDPSYLTIEKVWLLCKDVYSHTRKYTLSAFFFFFGIHLGLIQAINFRSSDII